MRIAVGLSLIIVLVVAGGYLALCFYMLSSQARFLFPGAFMPLPAEIADMGRRMGLEAIDIRAADGANLYALQSWPDEKKPIVILFHGNASYPESYGFLYVNWIGAGYGIVAPAARGYPRSGGATDGEMMLADALSVYDWTARTYPDHPIYVIGQSLGTAPAVHLAANRTVAGVVLISPFQSMLSLVQGKMPYLPVSWLLKSPFRSDLDMQKITAPVIIFHGSRDTLVPIASGRALAALAKTRVGFEVIDNAGHTDGLFMPEMIKAIDTSIGISTQ